MAPAADIKDVIDAHIKADGLPHPGDKEWDEYCQLAQDVSAAIDKPISAALLFSGRKQVVDQLWKLGYRKI